MVSTYTTNKRIEKPGSGDYPNAWASPVNSDWDIIDKALGSSTSLNASTGSATLTYTQYQSLIFLVSGAMTANVTYTIPAGIGGQWIVRNSTTDATGGPWTVTFASAGGGTTIAIDRLNSYTIFSDGTNVRIISAPAAAISGSNTQIIFNSSGNLSGSFDLTWDGTTFSTLNIYADGALQTTGAISAFGAITSSVGITAFSDRSLKKNIVTINNALSKVNVLRGVHYTAINTGEENIGVIAQEVQPIVPEVVRDNNGILSVAYGNLTALLIEAVKELTARLEILEKK